MRKFLIIVEGEADKKFFRDYYHHLFQQIAPESSVIHPGKDGDTGGYTKLKSEDALGAMRQNTDLGGINLVIFDADDDIESRRKELWQFKKKQEWSLNSFFCQTIRMQANLKICWS